MWDSLFHILKGVESDPSSNVLEVIGGETFGLGLIAGAQRFQRLCSSKDTEFTRRGLGISCKSCSSCLLFSGHDLQDGQDFFHEGQKGG